MMMDECGALASFVAAITLKRSLAQSAPVMGALSAPAGPAVGFAYSEAAMREMVALMP